MSWDDVRFPAAGDESPASSHKPLAGCVKRLLADKNNRVLDNFLRAAIQTPSYAPGRDAADVAYREGYRAFALKLVALAEAPDE